MSLNCGCPAGASITSVDNVECSEGMGQIQKVIIQRVFASDGVKNAIPITGTNSITKKTSMTALFDAEDSTKMVITPFIQNPDTTPGEARTFGGGNQTLNGVEITIGTDPTSFTGIMYEMPQAIIAQLKTLSCENIGVYYIDGYGNIGCVELTNGNVGPIPIQSFFVGDKKFGGLDEPDSNSIKWAHAANWSDKFVIIKHDELDYNPLTDLVNAGPGPS